MWQAYLYDTITGQLAQQVDIPSFAWSMSVSDYGFTTTKDKNIGEDDVTGLELPWSQIPGTTQAAKAAAIQPYKRGLALFWKTPTDDPDSPGTPIIAGALGVRSSTWQDVSLPFASILGLLSDRILAHEGGFGTAANHTSTGSYKWEGLSWRALACEVVRQCTELKPGGSLPIDLPYLNEPGSHSLPVEDGDDEGKTNTTKTKKRVDTADGYIETVIDGDKTTITEQHTAKTTKKIQKTTTYTYHGKNGNQQRTRTSDVEITTAKTVTTIKTTIQNHTDYATKTTTTTITDYTYDTDGKQTGSQTRTSEPTTTTTARQSTIEYKDYNAANHICADILTRIANSDGGPDIQFRPYLTTDGQHIRFKLEAGSDGDIHLMQDKRLALAVSRSGGTLDNPRIDRDGPVMRVYGTGSGSGAGTLCDLAEDLSLTDRSDPWPLRESVTSDADARSWQALRSTTQALLEASNHPMAQLSGEINANDVDASGMPLHPLGSFWPGETFDVSFDGFPDWPDGVYPMRLMQMSGDETGKVTVKFDTVTDPFD